MTVLFWGGKAIVLDLFKPDLTLDAVAKYRATMMGQIPAMYNMQWRMPNYASFNMSSLRLAMWGGAAVSRPFVEKLVTMAATVFQGFGMTELSGLSTYFSTTE